MGEQWLKPTQVSQKIGFSINTLAMWRKQGTGPPFVRRNGSLRGRVHYREADVEDWMKEQSARFREVPSLTQQVEAAHGNL